MTTANLSVALRTEKAREALRQLREQMAQGMGSTVLKVDAARIAEDLQKELSRREFTLKIDTKALRRQLSDDIGASLAGVEKDLGQALDKAVGKKRDIRFQIDADMSKFEASLSKAAKSDRLDVKFNIEAKLTDSIKSAEAFIQRFKDLQGDLLTSSGKVAASGQRDYDRLGRAIDSATERIKKAQTYLKELEAPPSISQPTVASAAQKGIGKVKYDVEVMVTDASKAALRTALQAALNEPFEVRAHPLSLRHYIESVLRDPFAINLTVAGESLRKQIAGEAAGTPVAVLAPAGAPPRVQPPVEIPQLTGLNNAIAELVDTIKKMPKGAIKKTATEAFEQDGKLTKGDPQPRYSVARSAKREDGTTVRMSQALPMEQGAEELNSMLAARLPVVDAINAAKLSGAQRKLEAEKAELLAKANAEATARLGVDTGVKYNVGNEESYKRFWMGADLSKYDKAAQEVKSWLAAQTARLEEAAAKKNQQLSKAFGIFEGNQYNVGNEESYKRFWMGADLSKYDKAAQEVKSWLAAETRQVEEAALKKNQQISAAMGFDFNKKYNTGSNYEAFWFKAMQSEDERSSKKAAAFGPTREDMHRLRDQYNLEQNKEPKLPKPSDMNLDPARIRAWSEAANEAHSAARGLAGSLGMLWTTWGSTIPIVAAASLGAAMRGVYEEGKRVEYQLAFVKGLSGTTISTEQFESTVKGSMFGSKDAADGLRALTQSGLGAKEALAALPDVLMLATVGETSVSEAAFAATGVMKAFGLGIADLGRVSDVLAKGAAASNASVTDMMEAMKYASAASSLYGEKLEETAAAVAVLSEKNIKGSMAGTAHMNLLKEIYTPTKKASEAFHALGLDMQAMQRAGLTSAEMIDKIREKTATLDSTSLRSFAAAVGGERGNRELAPLLEAGTGKVREMQAQLEASSGFTRKVMNELADTVEASQARVKQAFSFSFSKVFDEGRGSVQAFNDALANAVGSEEFQRTLSSLARGVINLASSLVEHADLIKFVGIAYGGLKVANVAASAVDRMAFSMQGSSRAMLADLAVAPAFMQSIAVKTGLVEANSLAEAQRAVAISRGTLASTSAVPVIAQQAAATAAATATTTASAAASGVAAAASFTLAGAMRSVSGAMAAVGAAARLAMGPLGLIISVGSALWAVWELVGSKTDSAREAQERYNNRANNTIRILDQEIERLERKAELRKNEGKTEAQVSVTSQRERLQAYMSEVDKAGAIVAKGYQRGRMFRFADESGKEQLYSDKDIQRLMADQAENKKKLDAIKEREGRVNSLQTADDKAEAAKSMNDWFKTSLAALKDRRDNTKDKKAIGEIDTSIKELERIRSIPEFYKGLNNTRDAENVQRSLKGLVDAGGQKINFQSSDNAVSSSKQEKKDLLASFKYEKELLQLRDKQEKKDQEDKESGIKTMLKTGLITKEAALDAELKLDEEHYDKMLSSRAAYNDKLAKLLRTSLKDGINPGDEDIVSFMRRKMKEGAEKGEDPGKVIGDMLKTKKDKNGNVSYDLMDSAQAISAITTIQGNQEEVDAAKRTLDQKRKNNEELVADIKRDNDAKFKAFLQKLQDDSAREVFKDVAKLGDLRSDTSMGAGPGAMNTMFPVEFVRSLDSRGLTQQAAEMRSRIREGERRDNFINQQQRKIQMGSKPMGRVARDESMRAGMQEYDRFMPEIQGVDRNLTKLNDELAEQIKKRQQLIDTTGQQSSVEIDALTKSIEGKKEEIKTEQQKKEKIEETMAATVEYRMKVAASIAEEQRTVGYGMRRFWDNYQNQAEDSARVVESVMGQAFSSLETGLARFTQTGKANFKDFTRSLLADAARMAQNAVIRKMLSMAGSAMFGGSDAGTGPSNAALEQQYSFGSGFQTTMSANGNIMTSNGPLPLVMHANGGIANRPMLSVFGEGRQPEAYVPLPDGRTIPVTISGAMGGGDTTQINSNVYVTIAADGKATVKSENNSAQAEQLGKMMDQAVVTVIQRELRPGGILYR